MATYHFNKECNAGRLHQEITESAIATPLDGIICNENGTDVSFTDTLSANDETLLNTIVDAHENTPLPQTDPEIIAEIARDTEGALLSRNKITKTGWHYQPHALSFKTAKLASIYNKNVAGNDLGFSTIKLYKSNGDEITDSLYENLCVKTVVEWMPTHDYEIVGAKFYQDSTLDTDIYMWVIGVPDIPAQYGGSIPFGQGGVNLRWVASGQGLNTDGRSSKLLVYDATNKTNKFQLVFKHNAGVQHDCMMVWEIYKAP